MITTKLKLLLPVLALTLFVSCSWEKDMGMTETGQDNEVVFSMRIPANYNITRSLDPKDEDEVRTLDVLVFDNNSGKLLSRSTNSGAPKPNGEGLDFYVRLEKNDLVTNYDFILLANSRDIITSELYTDGALTPDQDKESVQRVLKATLKEGIGWIANNSDSGYKAMPMWGELNDQTIEPGKNYTSTTLTRATLKVDVTVDLETAGSFKMLELWYYHYNTEGYIIPLKANLNISGKPLQPTVDDLTLHTSDPIDYSDALSEGGQSLVGTIYGFEALEGVKNDPGYLNNPCLLIKGDFNGTEGWYRMDFANVDQNTLQPLYLPLLRNHYYDVKITAINGPGYPDPGEALNSKPGNIGTEISVWETGDNVGGVWNGNYEIKFSSLVADFTQFGEPSPQKITITTNCPSLTFDNFTNISKGSKDGDWDKDPSGIWSNGHFSVETIEVGTDADGNTTHLIIITADETDSGDAKRESRFKIKGSNMEANFRITQDPHVEFRLISDPNPMVPIMLDGAKQRIKINVTSTHNYSVELKYLGTDMFPHLYEEEVGGSPIEPENISNDITTIYVEVDAHIGVNPRVGTFIISHYDDPLAGPDEKKSDASPLSYSVLQVTPVITATIVGEGYSATIPQIGGNLKINVVSNISEWVPSLERKIGEEGNEENLTNDADLTNYLGITKGSGSMQVTFTAPAITGENNYFYTVKFKDKNGTTVSQPPLVITQVSVMPGSGGGGIPPTDGVRAEEFILAVDENGILNLDGPDRSNNWLVYFKWGSTIAISGGPKYSFFNRDRIAWTPSEYNYNALYSYVGGTSTVEAAWSRIPYIDIADYGSEFPHENTPEQLAAGWGDPCRLAVKDGEVGDYKMPSGNLYEQFTQGDWGSSNGINGHWSNYGSSQSQFYPAAGFYNGFAGDVVQLNTSGSYWSSTPTPGTLYGNTAYHLTFMLGYCNNAGYSSRAHGFTIRCIRAN